MVFPGSANLCTFAPTKEIRHNEKDYIVDWRTRGGCCFGRVGHHMAQRCDELRGNECAEMSVPDTTVRLSIGLEAGKDLLEDIKQAV